MPDFSIYYATNLASRKMYPSRTKVAHLTTGDKLTVSLCLYLLLKTWTSLAWSWSQWALALVLPAPLVAGTMPCRGESLSTLFLSKTTISKGFIEFDGVFRGCIAPGAARIGTMGHEMHLPKNGVWRGQLHHLWDGPLTRQECLYHI